MPRKRINTKSFASVRRSTRIKRDELKDEQHSNEAAVQEVFPEDKEIQPELLSKKRTKSVSPVFKSKKARNEDEKQQQIEEIKIDVVSAPDNVNQESEPIKRKDKGKNKVIESVYEDNKEDASSTSFMSFKSLFNEKLNIATSLSNIPTNNSSDKMNIDESDSLVQEKWEKIKAELFEVPKKPFPEYREYQEKLFTKQPWMKKKDVDYLQKLFTNPKSMLGSKQLKVSVFILSIFIFADC